MFVICQDTIGTVNMLAELKPKGDEPDTRQQNYITCSIK